MVSRKDFEKVRKNIQDKRNKTAIEETMKEAMINRARSENIFKSDTKKPKKAFRDTELGKLFSKSPARLVKDYIKKKDIVLPSVGNLSYGTRKKLMRFAMFATPIIIVGAVNFPSKGEKLETRNTINVETLMAENHPSKTTFTASADTIAAVSQDSVVLSSDEITGVLANKLSLEQNAPIKKNLSNEELTELAREEFAKLMVEENANTLANFDLSNKKFTADELQMIQLSDEGKKIISDAQRVAKRGRPASGEQTMCLGGVKTILARSGIKLDASRFAYRAIEGMQKNEDFVEIKCEMKDFGNLPDGAVIVWGKGSGRACYGHIAIKVGNMEYCDYRYGLRKSRQRSGGTYGEPHVFIPKSYTMDKSLTGILFAENLANAEITNMIAKKHDIRPESNTFINFAAQQYPSLYQHQTAQDNLRPQFLSQRADINLNSDKNNNGIDERSKSLSKNNTQTLKKANVNFPSRNIGRGYRA